MTLGLPRNGAGALSMTTTAAGATWSGGFLRAPTGELVADLVGPWTDRNGFKRAASGALGVIAEGTVVPAGSRGWPRNSSGLLVTTATGPGTDVAGLKRDASGRLVAVGLTTAVNTVAPVIAGPIIQAQTMGLWVGTWTGPPTITFTQQWQNSPDGVVWTDIGGATDTSYLLTAGDVGKVLRARVTGTNADGSVTVSSNTSATITTGTAPFMRDSFTGTNGVTVQSRAGEVGATWTKHASSTASADETIRSNRAMGSPIGGTTLYYTSATPPSADYTVTCLITEITNSASSSPAAAGRLSTTLNTMYVAQYATATGACNLLLLNNGAATTLGTVTLTPRVSITLKMVGSAISMLADGVQVIAPVTDTTIATAGRAGLRHGGTYTTTTGVHIDNIEAV